MTCNRIRKLIPLAVSRDLEPGVLRAVEDHTKTCLACFRELRAYAEQFELRAVLKPAALDAVPEEFGTGIVDDVMGAIRRGEDGPAAPIARPLSPAISRLVRYGVAVAAGFALFAVLRFSADPGSPGPSSGSPPGIVQPARGTRFVTPASTNGANGPIRTERLPPVRLVQHKNDF